ncbi:aminopeptidase N [Agarivorans sp. 1_MG-2023]|uniref:aminopeptidase N n=1 Tax=Agarivorans sp. 1_MG-2023 TaxID=3062634 RepID=UPI0026E18BCD|nr:aminopeptidase N [Agarivorans sp. 1_MG-2023]MDO6762101.1 aminopeptidase N [Agarivorans sp. 1_MG-2023]
MADSSAQPTAKFRSDYQAPAYTIDSVALEFDLEPQSTRVTAVSSVVRKAEQACDLILDGEKLELVSLRVNGNTHQDYQKSDSQLVIRNLPEQFELAIVTQINPAENKAFEGLYQSGDAFCTQCEAEGFRRITYFLDRPDVLATYSTKIIADQAQYPFLLSNGNKVDQGELENGKHWVSWQDPFPKPCYLFALVAGDFDLLEDSFVTQSGRTIALELFVDKGNLNRTEHAMASLKASMKWDEERFNLEYDLDIYMIVAVDFFNMGAMENKGLNVFNSKYVLANKESATDNDFLGIEAVIGHEYFHNWTGNRITCRDWFQLSLKEGLTVFRDQEFSSDLGSRAVNRIKNVRVLRSHQFAEDAGPMAHPIRPDKVIEMNNFYTLTVYEKGAEVIRMLHTLLGEEGFQAGMQTYVERHDGQAATCDDFVSAMQDASGKDLTVFKRWYSQSGTPILNVESTYDEVNKQFSLSIRQHTPATAEQTNKQALHIPVSIELLANSGQAFALEINGSAVSEVLELTEDKQTWLFDNISEQPTLVMLQEFSAPVKLELSYSTEQLLLIINHASNTFARWDGMQKLVTGWMVQAVSAIQQDKALEIDQAIVTTFRQLLEDQNIDKGLLAELLTISGENEIADSFERVDIDAIAKARDFFIEKLAEHLAEQFLVLEQRCAEQDQQSLAHSDIALRSLRAACLQYLAYSKPSLVADAYFESPLMTNKLAAMSAANNAAIEQRAAMFNDYEKNWQHDGLVMDKWLALQASFSEDGALERVKGLSQHPSFTMENPNRVRSLMGSFANNNARHFHAKDGSGYRYLTDILCILNTQNPQVASRLITPLIQTVKLDDERKGLIIKQLERLAGLDDLSKDLFEKVTNGLQQLKA